QTLDAMYRSDHLAAYARRVAEADFRVRKPLADEYRELALHRLTPQSKIDAAVRRVERPGMEDLRMGALVHARAVAAHLAECGRLAAAAPDPWFTEIAEREAARAERARGAVATAERKLRGALGLAHAERLGYRALLIENDIIELDKAARRLG